MLDCRESKSGVFDQINPAGLAILAAVFLAARFLFLLFLAQITGHWKTSISPAEYRRLVPDAAKYTHP